MARDKSIRITVLGTRGSTPTCGVDYAEFGGNTSCYLVEAGGESILLDAGSGLANAPSESLVGKLTSMLRFARRSKSTANRR